MNQSDDVIIKCPNSEHTNNVKLLCFDESCKGERLYCIQCIKNGIHVSHPQHQEELPQLFEHISRVEMECDDLINKMNKQMDLVYQDFYQLIGGIRSKYQISKQQFLTLNSQQMNYFLVQSINFKSFEYTIENLVQQFTNEFQGSIQKLLFDLQLYFNLQHSLKNYFNQLYLNQLIIKYLTQIQVNQKNYINKDTNSIICWDNKFDQAIKILDQALSLNSKHQLSLWCKAESLIDQNESDLLQECLVNIMKQSFGQIKHCKWIQNIVIHYSVKRRVQLTKMKVIQYKNGWLIQQSNHLGRQSIASGSKTLQFIIVQSGQFNLSE